MMPWTLVLSKELRKMSRTTREPLGRLLYNSHLRLKNRLRPRFPSLSSLEFLPSAACAMGGLGAGTGTGASLSTEGSGAYGACLV